jgi:hypothetical protein
MKELSMKNQFVLILLSGILLCGLSFAQNRQPTPSQPQQPGSASQSAPGPNTPAADPAQNPAKTRIAPGSVIPVLLTKTVDAKKAKTGDEVIAKVTQDMKTSSGTVLVPKDTEVIGHVTEAQRRSKGQKESDLGIAFDRALVKGDQMQMPMSIQAVIAPPSNSPSNAGANDQTAPTPGAGAPPAPAAGGAEQSPMGGRNTGAMGVPTSEPPPNYPQPSGNGQSQTQSKPRPEINAHTQGVIGISHMKLESTAQKNAQGSVLTSEKGNVKIERGTLMLLRVNP